MHHRIRHFLFFIISIVLFSSSSSAGDMPAPKGTDVFRFMKARSLVKSKKYVAALALYKEISDRQPENPWVWFRIGECQALLNNQREAIKYFEKTLQLNPKFYNEVHFLLAKACHAVLEIDKALAEYNIYKKNNPVKAQKNEVDKLIMQCEYAVMLMKKPLDVIIRNAGVALNSKYSDYAPSVTADGNTMVFTSRRENTTGQARDPEDMQFFEDIYKSSWIKEKKMWGDPLPLYPPINTDGHDAALSISPGGNILFIYKNNLNGIRGGDIYQSLLGADGIWMFPKPLPVAVNSPYFESSASITEDGKMLYFVSERTGGYGNGDIYRCVKKETGEWGPAENLGALINTEEDEICAFISPDGNTLYFSSRGHLSMGGYDIFKSTLQNGKWSPPENIGYPVNTAGDDLHFVMTAGGTRAFYSAVRDSGFGDRDIYTVDFLPEEKPLPQLQALVFSASVHDSSGKIPDGVEISISDSICTIGKFGVDAFGLFKTLLVQKKHYAVTVRANGYEDTGFEFDTPDSTAVYIWEKPVVLISKLSPVLFEEKKTETEAFKYVFFQHSSSDLQLDADSKIKIEEVMRRLKKNHRLKVMLAGHADNTGTTDFNKQLSVKRAKIVAAYLQKKGLSAARIKIVSWGDKKPLGDNTTEEGRRQNRRVEVTVF